MLNQSHRVPEPRINDQGRNVIIRLPMKIPRVEPYIPRDRCPTNKGLLILEAGDNRGDELSSSAADGDGLVLDDDDSPGPDIRARLEGQALLDLL